MKAVAPDQVDPYPSPRGLDQTNFNINTRHESGCLLKCMSDCIKPTAVEQLLHEQAWSTPAAPAQQHGSSSTCGREAALPTDLERE